MGRRNPYRQGGLATPPPQLDDDEPDTDEPEPNAGDDDEPDNGDDSPESEDDDEPAGGSASSSRPWRLPRATGAAGSGAGFLLGLLVWGWFVLPFVKHGPKGVTAVLRAKFLNQAPDGSDLP